MGVYPESYKLEIVQRILSTPGLNITLLSQTEQISKSAIYRWLREHKDNTISSNDLEADSLNVWSQSAKLLALQETYGLSNEALNSYCRQNGVYTEDLENWRKEFMSPTDNEKLSALKKELTKLKEENKSLKQDVRRKEKALAETAALLVLKKKAAQIWGEQEDD